MNAAIVGAGDKTDVIISTLQLNTPFLLIDDGPIIHALTVPLLESVTTPNRPRVLYFDHKHHSFNPLMGINYLKAREFIEIVDAVFPQGENTLTRKNSNAVILSALLKQPRNLRTLIRRTRDPASIDAHQKIETLMLSPVLSRVLSNPINFSLHATVLARLDRAQLGDFDAFVLASLLISQYPGQIVIPDFGFYGRDLHTSLIRQGRLVAGVNFLSEVPSKMRDALLTARNKIAFRTNPSDAETLLPYLHTSLFMGRERRSITKPQQIMELADGEYLVA
ncbi:MULTISPECIES: hypothetical protein [unclassified Bradyrhizobium]|uniref:hypothetical protein n=1 Tax=unclassified Bradyrhizobium TaxID=2631580 RepID=UPI002916A261|nr:MULTISPECIES: hypothetical protein [unclassified Bradyrhizobium]